MNKYSSSVNEKRNFNIYISMETEQTQTATENRVLWFKSPKFIVINGPWVEFVLSIVLKKVLHLFCMDLFCDLNK